MLNRDKESDLQVVSLVEYTDHEKEVSFLLIGEMNIRGSNEEVAALNYARDLTSSLRSYDETPYKVIDKQIE